MKLKKSLLTLLSIQLFLLGTESLTSTTGPFTNTQLYSPVAEMTFESGLGDSSGYRTRFEYTNSGSYEYNF